MDSNSSNHFYRLVLQYDGTDYLGWQVQTKQSKPTVQGELNQALKLVSKSDSVRSVGSGRTDAGVHAMGQVVKVDIPLKIAPENLVKALNVNLPESIRVREAQTCAADFRPTVDAIWKEYHYLFTCAPLMENPFARRQMGYFSFPVNEHLMQQACELFVGEHDFQNFFCVGTEVSTTVREVFSCSIERVVGQDFLTPYYYRLRFRGNGFLKQMVRMMVGAIWKVGAGRLELEALKRSLNEKRSRPCAPVAPPEGLYLMQVQYPTP